MDSTSTSSSHGRQLCCFQKWLVIQELDLSEMLQALQVQEDEGSKDVLLEQIIQKSIDHFQAYAEQRTRLALDHVSPFFAPSWCSTLENSLLWLAGCRPSLFIRLIYALSGQEIDKHIKELLEGTRTVRDLGGLSLSSMQLTMVNNLQTRTIREEEKLSERLASLQERMADYPFALIAKELSRSSYSDLGSGQADQALYEHERSMLNLLREADMLRLNTLKELMDILSPSQAVDFLAVGKKLHLFIHDLGKKRDIMHQYTT